MKKRDAIIIGSGISALTCALLLAKRGKSVTVLEQYKKPGGYLHCFSRFGERFDTGAHYVGAMDPGHPFHTLLSYLGVYGEEEFVALDPSGFDEFHFPEFTVQMPKGYPEAVARLSELFPHEHAAIAEFFTLVRQAVQFFPTYEFNDSMQELPMQHIFETSLATVVRRLTSNPRLQCTLFAYCGLHGVQPDDVAFGFHALVVDSLVRSPYGLKNGGDALTQKFVRQLEALGGEVLLGHKVVQLEIRDQHIKRVVTEAGAEFESEWVISAIHPKATFALCDDVKVFSPLFARRLEALKESVGLFGISALTTDTSLNPLRNYYFFESSDPQRFLLAGEADATPGVVFLSSARRVPSENRIQPINLHSPAPHTWFSQWRESAYAKRSEEYKSLKLSLAENVFARVEQYRPGFREQVTRFATSTPLTNLHFNGSAEGSAYGLYHSIQNTGPRAIGPRTKVLNLLLTGQNCLFPGLLGAAIAGLRTSGHIVGIKPVLGELKELGANA